MNWWYTYREAILENWQISPVCSVVHIAHGTGATDDGERQDDDHEEQKDFDDRRHILEPRKHLVWETENGPDHHQEDGDFTISISLALEF